MVSVWKSLCSRQPKPIYSTCLINILWYFSSALTFWWNRMWNRFQVVGEDLRERHSNMWRHVFFLLDMMLHGKSVEWSFRAWMGYHGLCSILQLCTVPQSFWCCFSIWLDETRHTISESDRRVSRWFFRCPGQDCKMDPIHTELMDYFLELSFPTTIIIIIIIIIIITQEIGGNEEQHPESPGNPNYLWTPTWHCVSGASLGVAERWKAQGPRHRPSRGIMTWFPYMVNENRRRSFS